jgi:Kef-type K+ transport system membrane component KefB
VLTLAVLAPILAELPLGMRMPTVVIEMVLGVIVGPHVLKLVNVAVPTEPVLLLGDAGLTFLFFLVGMEIDLARFRGPPLTLALRGWVCSLAIASLVATLLWMVSFVRAPVMVGIALTTTATGMLVPILRDADELETAFGSFLLAAGTIGEFGPIIVVALILTRKYSYSKQTALMMIFVAAAITCSFAAMRVHPPRLIQLLRRTLHNSSQLPVRICMFALSFFVVLAGGFGFDATLGAFAAGMVVGLAARGVEGHALREKLDAIGYGYFVPFFFVASGMKLDLGALENSHETLFLVPLFLVLFLVARGLPVFLYRQILPKELLLPMAFYSATALPMIVAITDFGIQTHTMLPDVAAALVGAGMLSTLIYPAVAEALISRGASLTVSEVTSSSTISDS